MYNNLIKSIDLTISSDDKINEIKGLLEEIEQKSHLYSIDNIITLAYVFNFIAYVSQTNYHEAIKYYLKARDAYQLLLYIPDEIEGGEYELFGRIGAIYYDITVCIKNKLLITNEIYEKNLLYQFENFYLKLAIDFYEKISRFNVEYEYCLATYNYDIATNYKEQQNVEYALEHYQKAYNIFKNIKLENNLDTSLVKDINANIILYMKEIEHQKSNHQELEYYYNKNDCNFYSDLEHVDTSFSENIDDLIEEFYNKSEDSFILNQNTQAIVSKISDSTNHPIKNTSTWQNKLKIQKKKIDTNFITV